MAPRNQRWWLTQDSATLDIEADARMLYGMVSDLPRIGEWSPECEGVDWEGDVAVPVDHATFVGHNGVGPGRRIRCSRRGRDSTAWRYRFEPLADGRTQVTESYEVRWIPTWTRILDPSNRHKELRLESQEEAR